jgi:hypothetical protein
MTSSFIKVKVYGYEGGVKPRTSTFASASLTSTVSVNVGDGQPASIGIAGGMAMIINEIARNSKKHSEPILRSPLFVITRSFLAAYHDSFPPDCQLSNVD